MNGTHSDTHIIRYLVNKRELNELYVSTVLRTLAFSMIGIFVPLFLFKELAYTLQEIIYFYLVYSVFFLIFTPIGAKLGNYIGIKHLMLISTPFYIAYFAMLYALENNPSWFYYIPTAYGIAEGLFWIGFHIDFSMFSQSKYRGNQISKFYGFALLAGLVGPMIGGAVLTFSDFNLLFFTVVLLLIGSAVPLFFSKDIKRDYKLSWKFLNVGSFKDFVSYSSFGAKGMVAGIFFPIFVFSILGLYAVMGSLFTFLGLLNLAIIYFMGKLTDVFSKSKLVKIFSIFNSIIWVVKIFVKTKMELIGVAALSSSTDIAVSLPYTAIMYDKCKKNIDYLIFREVGLSIGRIIVLLLVLATGSLLSSFLYAAIASLGYMLL